MKHSFHFFVSIFSLLLIAGHAFAINDPKYPYHPAQNVPLASSNLPVVVINLSEVMASKMQDRRIDAIMTVVYHTDGTRNYLTDTVSSNWNNPNIINYRGHVAIKYRGNSSFDNSPKKPFSLKTQDASGSNIDVNMLGIGADKDWELLAPYNDRSMIRDVLIFDLMRPYLDYTPHGKFCELVLNGVYQGIYIMTAKVDRGDNRINIPKPGASGNNLTGGYHLEMDRNDEPVFWCNYHPKDLYGNNLSQSTCYQYKYPEYEDYQDGMQTQKNYIENRVHQMENTIAGNDFKDPVRGYRKELDVTSVIDFMLAQEFGHNVDGYRLSSPFYKYRDNVDPHFKFSIWDFNLSMGNADYYEGWSTEGWQWNMNGVPSALGDGNMIPFFFKRLLEDEVFRMEMRERWAYFRETSFSDQSLQNKIDSLQVLLQEASGRNFAIWSYWGSHVWPNYYVSESWIDELSYLRRWIGKRVAWMDSQLLTSTPVNLIRNGNFDSDMKRGPNNNNISFSCWMLNGNVGLSTTSPLNGTYNLSFRDNNASARQTLTELNKGNYTLKAWVRTVESPSVRVVITPMNGSPVTYHINNNNHFQEITVQNIQISSGVCDIKFETYNSSFGGNTRVYLDSISFFQQPESNYAYHPDAKTDISSTNLPIMLFNVNSSFSATGNTETLMSLIYRTNGMKNRITDLNPANIPDSTVIQYHGNIHLELVPSADDKKSFVLYTKDNSNNYQNVNLLGLGTAHQWKL
ncbi:MAG: CotH kinase family protein, partial [Bacteroidales bacterium]|nr:CotH kinase family protein [Bacteroidales bacterium]